MIGYENHSFLCSVLATTEIVTNICKAVVLGGYWVTFLGLHNLSSKIMSVLSNTMTQLIEKSEYILINNDKFKTPNFDIIIFATTSECNKYLTNSSIDSLKITKIDHFFNLITKDLFDKFRVVRFEDLDANSFISSNLISNGFNNRNLSQELINLIDLYKNVLKENLVRNGKLSN